MSVRAMRADAASLGFHQQAGFRERVGRHAARGNRWRDVVFIERRNPIITEGHPLWRSS